MADKPNVIVIFTDNQQASTLGCYGNEEVYTPNLNRLSKEGLTFDNAFCPNAFCSPCRASFLTGMLPSQHGVHSWIDDRRSDGWPNGWHALDGMDTLPVAMKRNGYSTALVGKYHLGDPATPAEGFDNWVTLKDGHIRSFYRNQIFDNGRTYEQPGHAVDFFSDKAVEFMGQQTEEDNPFFLYLPYPAPYGHWPATKEPEICRHTERYAECPMESVPRQGLSKKAVDGFLRNQAGSSADLDFSMLMRAPNDLDTLRNYYSQISMVDDGVGQIMDAVERLGIAENTLLIFTTDHGLSIGQHGFWGHGGACFPSNLHRAAHSIPLILCQKGKVPEGNRSKLMVSNMDLYSTVLDYAGIEPLQSPDILPSRSLLSAIKGEDEKDWEEDAVYSEQEETRVLRTSKWVFFKRFEKDGMALLGNELYDVEHDPTECENLSGVSEHKKLEEEFCEMIDRYFEKFSRKEADLWSGGVPIQNTIRQTLWREAWGESWSPVFAYEES